MNKSKLLASTMLVSAAALAATGTANAASLKLGGFFEAWAGIGDQNNTAKAKRTNVNDFDVKIDSEIHFKAEETLDNGIKVGALLELEAGAGNDNNNSSPSQSRSRDGFDESFGWVKTKYGQINLGNNDQATGYVGGVSAVGPVGVVKSDASDWLPAVSQQLTDTDVDLGLGDAQNITYFSPRVAGAQIVVSYAPDNSDRAASAAGVGSDFDDSETGGQNNGFSGAILYGAKFGGAAVKVQAGMTHVKEDRAAAPDAGTGSRHSDGHAVHVGVKFGPANLTGAYAKENLNTNNASWFGVGLIYSISKMDRVSIAWGQGETFDVQGSPDVTNDIITAGWERNVGKGIAFAASIFHSETDSGVGSNDSGFGAVTGFKLKF